MNFIESQRIERHVFKGDNSGSSTLMKTFKPIIEPKRSSWPIGRETTDVHPFLHRSVSVRQYRCLLRETAFKCTFFLLPFNRLAEEKSLLLDTCDYQDENDLFHSSPRGETIASFVLCAIPMREWRRIRLT